MTKRKKKQPHQRIRNPFVVVLIRQRKHRVFRDKTKQKKRGPVTDDE